MQNQEISTTKLAEAQVQVTNMQQIEQKRHNILNEFGQKKSIYEYVEIGEINSYSDYTQYRVKWNNRKSWTLEQWRQSGKICQEIRAIDLSQTNLESIPKQLNLFPNLVELNLGKNKIKDVEPLKALTQLEVLWLNQNNITEIQALSNLNHLVGLYIYGNNITQIGGLSNLTNLIILWIYSNSIIEIGGLSKLTKLAVMSIYGNNITEIGVLSSLTNLIYLSLYDNKIKSLGNIHLLNNLTYLYISTKDLENVEAEKQKLEILEKNECNVIIG